MVFLVITFETMTNWF